MAVVGRSAEKAARAVLAWARGAYRAVDPDVRQHLAELPLLATTMVGPRQKRIERRDDDGRRPVICIHGLGGHPDNFLPLRAVLALDGRRRVYAMSYDDGKPLDVAARALADVVAEVKRVNQLGPQAQVDLVAHSMGGLVARLSLLDEAFTRQVAQLITVGTPHQGTLAARFAGGARGQDLRPDSALLARLGRQVPWRGPPRLIAFYSPSDVLMLPAQVATLEGADNRQLPGLSHHGYLLRPRALLRIAKALDEPLG